MGSSAGLDNTHLIDADKLDACVGGNTGNLAFASAIARHLNAGAAVVPWHMPAHEVKAMADILVIACANQIGPHVDLGDHAGHLEAVDLPIVALGLGAQADSLADETRIPEGTRRWLDVVADHAPSDAPNIGVRGAYSLRQLERLGLGRRADVIGCPSNFTTLESDFAGLVAARLGRPIRRVAAAVGQPHWPHLAEIERAILDLVEATDGSCVVQHDKLMIRLGQAEFAAIAPDDFELLRRYFRPLLSNEAFALWCRRHMLCFGNVPAWTNWLARHDFVVGPRFHGVMLAIQAGVPAGCVAHDSRTLELCQTTGIPVRMAQEVPLPLTLQSLPALFPFDADAYRRKRADLARSYVAILDGAGLDLDPRLRALARATEQPAGAGSGSMLRRPS